MQVRDATTYGLGVWLRRFGPKRMVGLRIPAIGEAYIRTGDSDFDCIKQVFSWMEYDLSHLPKLQDRIRDRYHQILSEGKKPIIVDAGANIGAATLWFGHCFPGAAIIAVEPDPSNAEVLRMNVANRPGVTVLEAAIGSERGHVELTHPDESWAIQTVRAEDGVEIKTIEDAFAASGGEVPFIVKVDIEGFESDLFARNLKWLDQAFVVIIEPHDWMMPGAETSRTFQSAMGSRCFELFIKGENLIYVRT